MKLLAILLISLLASPVAAQQYWEGQTHLRQVERQKMRIEMETDRINRNRAREGYRVYRGNPNQYHPRRDRRANRSFSGLTRWLRY
jgi:hypothetical protein